jgi:hypothetical protein
MPKDQNKQEAAKLLYEITFWKENRDWSPSQPHLQQIPSGKEFYVKAVSPKHAKETLKKRFQTAARESGKVSDFGLVSLFVRDDIQIKVVEIKKYEQYDESRPTNCQNCGAALDDDYCQECGLRRESWLSNAMQKISSQGKTTVGKE